MLRRLLAGRLSISAHDWLFLPTLFTYASAQRIHQVNDFTLWLMCLLFRQLHVLHLGVNQFAKGGLIVILEFIGFELSRLSLNQFLRQCKLIAIGLVFFDLFKVS